MVAAAISYSMSAFFVMLTVAGLIIAFTPERNKVSPPRLISAIALFGFIAWLFAYLGGI